MDGRWKLFSFLCMDEVLLRKANYWEGQQQGEENLELGRHIELVNLIRKMKTNWLFCFLVCYGTQSEIASVKLTQQTKSRDLWSYTVLRDEVTPSESRARGAELPEPVSTTSVRWPEWWTGLLNKHWTSREQTGSQPRIRDTHPQQRREAAWSVGCWQGKAGIIPEKIADAVLIAGDDVFCGFT